MRAFGRARQVCEPMQLISAGWAGALREEMVPGAVVKASMVRDLNTGEMFAAEGNGGLLLTLRALRFEKRSIAWQYI